MINLLSSTAYLIVNKRLSQKVGLQAAALLADLISKQIYFENEQGIIDYFFNTQENIQKDTTLSIYQQRAALSKLKEFGLVSVKLMGIPAKRHFKVNAHQVMQLLHDKECSKPKTINKNKVITNNILQRREAFNESVLNLCYAEKLLDDTEATKFIDYWTEPNKSNTKMRWEMQKTWQLTLRLKNWAKRVNQWAKPLNLKTANSKIDSQLEEYNKGKQYL
jgi:hypothetical protein